MPRSQVTRQQVTAELRHLLSELRGEPIFLGGYEQERRLLDLTLGFLKTSSSRRSACENGLLSILETQAGGGSSIYHALIPRLLLTFAPDGLEIHKEIALHHSFLPAGLTHALPRAVADLERLLRRGNGSNGDSNRPPEGSSDSDEETGHHPRGSTFQLLGMDLTFYFPTGVYQGYDLNPCYLIHHFGESTRGIMYFGTTFSDP